MTKLNREHIKRFKERNFGFLATLNGDGSPQVTPVWIDTDGRHVLVNTAIGRVKEKNTRRDPRVALAFTLQKDPYTWTMVRGRVTEWVQGLEAENHIDKLAEKYTGAEKFTKSDPSERRVIFKILPEHITG